MTHGLKDMTTIKIVENDAIVCLCLQNRVDSMSHHEFRVRAAVRGFTLSKSQAHNMLSRAMGRVTSIDARWKLTAMGLAYREEVVDRLKQLLSLT